MKGKQAVGLASVALNQSKETGCRLGLKKCKREKWPQVPVAADTGAARGEGSLPEPASP